MIIKLIRHGESRQQTGEVNATVIGDANVPLSCTGRSESEAKGVQLGHEFICSSLLYISPYLRTRQTLYGLIDGANCVLNGGITRVYEDPRLRESEFGFNKEPSDIRHEKLIRDEHGYFYYRYRGGESPADVYDRVSMFIDTMMRQANRKRISKVVIVSHGITIRCFVMRFLHLTVHQFDTIENPENCDIITIAPLDSRAMREPQFVSGKWGVSGLRWREDGPAISPEKVISEG